MAFFGRSKVPSWAAFFKEAEYLAFKGRLLDLSEGSIDASKASKDGLVALSSEQVVNLTNLATLCSNLDRNEWDSEIKRWVRVFAEGADRPEPLYPRDMYMLRLQLYPRDYLDIDGLDKPNLIYREDISGTLTTVVVDWPDSVRVLRDDDRHQWSKHQTEVFSRLLDELAKAKPYDISFMEFGDRAVAVLEDEDIMAATHALVLGKLYLALDTGGNFENNLEDAEDEELPIFMKYYEQYARAHDLWYVDGKASPQI